MLLAVIYPIVDARFFVTESGRSPKPAWPNPDSEEEFIRSFGGIVDLPNRSLAAWPSETKVCKVNNNLKLPEFNSIRSLIKSKTNSDIYFLFKRIIFDGISTGRLEIGFEIKTMDEMANWEDYDWLFSKVLEQTVLFHGQRKTLIGLGSEFSRSYLDSTTLHRFQSLLESYWVQASKPAIFIDAKEISFVYPQKISGFVKPILQNSTFLNHYRDVSGKRYREWFVSRKRVSYPSCDYENIRRLRIYLLRYFCYLRSLNIILSCVNSGAIRPTPFSPESNKLQNFLNDGLHQLNNLKAKTSKQFGLETNLLFADQLLDSFSGDVENLLNILKLMDIRPNLMKNVSEYSKTIIVARDLVVNKVESNYGIVGNTKNTGTINIENLTTKVDETKQGLILEQLSKISEYLEINKSEAQETIDQVEEMKQVVKRNEESTITNFVKKSGSALIDIASKVGADLLIAYIKSIQGL